VVTAHTLQEQPVKPGQPSAVALFFNSTIEFSLSKVQLVSGNDAHQTLPIKPGKKRGELLIELPALEAGNYALKYKVFAADGHLTEDVLRFRVAQ
jgi:methionine-rich copper-binding protein CopC